MLRPPTPLESSHLMLMGAGRSGGGGFVGPLDDYESGLLWLGSFSRKLLTSWEGGIVQLRRSSDDDELLLSAKANGDVNSAAGLSFVGAGNGYPSLMLDQTGNGNDLEQPNAALQMVMVEAGSLVTVGGKAAARGGRTDYLGPTDEARGCMFSALPAYTGNTLSVFLRVAHGTYGGWFSAIVDIFLNVAKNTSAGSVTSGAFTLSRLTTGNIQVASNYGTINIGGAFSSDCVMSIIFDGTNVTFRDGTNTYSQAYGGAFDINALTLCDQGGAASSGDYSAYAKRVSELAIWTTDQTANEAAIRALML